MVARVTDEDQVTIPDFIEGLIGRILLGGPRGDRASPPRLGADRDGTHRAAHRSWKKGTVSEGTEAGPEDMKAKDAPQSA